MLRRTAVVVIALSVSASAGAQSPPPPRAVPGFDPGALDRTADACDDFYQFACGGWMKNNPIPPDQSALGPLRRAAGAQPDARCATSSTGAASAARSAAVDQKIGDYYAALHGRGGDRREGRRRRSSPTLDEHRRAVQAKAELPPLRRRACTRSASNAFFSFGSEPDFKDATGR